MHLRSQMQSEVAFEISTNPRRFLSAFMVVYHSSETFGTMDDLAHAVLASATAMLATFELLIDGVRDSGILAGVDQQHTRLFVSQLLSFLEVFESWRVSGKALIVSRIRSRLIELYKNDAQLSSDHQKIHKVFVHQIERMRDRLRDVGGEQELERFDEAYAAGAIDLEATIIDTQPGYMDSQQLAHEILLNPHFELEDRSQNEDQRMFNLVGGCCFLPFVSECWLILATGVLGFTR